MWRVAAYRRTRRPISWLGLRVGGRLALSQHSSDEPGELYSNGSVMTTALQTLTLVYYYCYYYYYYYCCCC